jgi:hypothetical protein
VRREHQRAAVALEDGPDVLHPFDTDLRGNTFERSAEDEAALREEHPEMLERAAREAAPRGGREVGKGLGEIRDGESAAARQERVGKVAEPPPQPRRRGNRKRCDRRGEEPERYVFLRLRSRRTSTAIGISESTITTTTTMWM